jgi:hypothetical protein
VRSIKEAVAADESGCHRQELEELSRPQPEPLGALLIDERRLQDKHCTRCLWSEVTVGSLLRAFAKFIAGISTELRPVFEILRTASAVEPEMAKVFEEMDQFRMTNMQTYAKWIAARGPLRVSSRQAGEIIWALASPGWLSDTLIRTVLSAD